MAEIAQDKSLTVAEDLDRLQAHLIWSPEKPFTFKTNRWKEDDVLFKQVAPLCERSGFKVSHSTSWGRIIHFSATTPLRYAFAEVFLNRAFRATSDGTGGLKVDNGHTYHPGYAFHGIHLCDGDGYPDAAIWVHENRTQQIRMVVEVGLSMESLQDKMKIYFERSDSILTVIIVEVKEKSWDEVEKAAKAFDEFYGRDIRSSDAYHSDNCKRQNEVGDPVKDEAAGITWVGGLSALVAEVWTWDDEVQGPVRVQESVFYHEGISQPTQHLTIESNYLDASLPASAEVKPTSEFQIEREALEQMMIPHMGYYLALKRVHDIFDYLGILEPPTSPVTRRRAPYEAEEARQAAKTAVSYEDRIRRKRQK